MCDIWGHTCAAFICITPFRAASRGGEVAAVCSLCWVGTEVGPSVVQPSQQFGWNVCANIRFCGLTPILMSLGL